MILNLIKKIPIDLGQGSMRYKTKGKIIALSFILKNGQNKNALDIGFRGGYFSKLLESYGYNTTSTDIEKSYDKCEVVNANDPLPYESNSFNVIWCSEVIEHLKNPQETLTEFKRILKQDGVAILTTPNSRFWIFRILGLFGLTPQKLQREDHLHFFGIKDIEKFNPEYIYGFFPYMILKFRINKMINLLSPTFVFIIKK